ncbi:hypothetical protein RF11_16273 [Thelohanellus kitauei]|uniref:Uncharacterized protein n=1 Tax=Thelohanellus kitauei TaxID=669202 RepID=A0A0C2JIN5_THEKT|nr:hypothetical protein RF11_16273 [Thelohanellus kitauei]
MAKEQMSKNTDEVDNISRPARDIREKNSDSMGSYFICWKRGHFMQQRRLLDSGPIEAVSSRKFNKNQLLYEEENVGNVVSSVKDKIESDLILYVINSSSRWTPGLARVSFQKSTGNHLIS